MCTRIINLSNKETIFVVLTQYTTAVNFKLYNYYITEGHTEGLHFNPI